MEAFSGQSRFKRVKRHLEKVKKVKNLEIITKQEIAGESKSTSQKKKKNAHACTAWKEKMKERKNQREEILRRDGAQLGPISTKPLG